MATTNLKSRTPATKAKPVPRKGVGKPTEKAAPPRKSRVFSISFPEGMARQVERLAAEEDRSISEYFRELFRNQKLATSTRLFQELDTLKKTPQAYTADDVEGFVDEVRAEMWAKRKSKR